MANNAVVLTVTGASYGVEVKGWSTYEEIGEPIGCDRLDIVSTQKMRDLSRRLGFTVIGYVDKNGYSKDLDENSRMQWLSGYDVLLGDALLCGWTGNDCGPLTEDQVDILLAYLQHGTVPEQSAPAASCSGSRITFGRKASETLAQPKDDDTPRITFGKGKK